MAIERLRTFFREKGIEDRIREFEVSSATVELAAKAVGVIPARIAKTLSFKGKEGYLLVVTAGDARIDNAKFKAQFGLKAKMLSKEEVLETTGYEVGGVCSFDIAREDVQIYMDISMKRFETVFPACGSANSAIEVSCDEIFLYSNALSWVDVCKDWETE